MDLLQPLVIGLFGSAHCVGMCGPIALALPLKGNTWDSRLFSTLLYNLGRSVTYFILGLAFGLAGMGLHIWGLQQWVSIGLGTLMILSVGFPLLAGSGRYTRLTDRLYSGIRKGFGRFLGLRTYGSLLAVGLLNGLLPCGLVYIALAGALVSSGPFEGGWHMLVFGLGTIPALLTLTLVKSMAGARVSGVLRNVMPFLVLLIGVLFVLRGMNLGIPYVSPKMEPQAIHRTDTLQKPRCCH
ncbi:MAG TPA: sulfite exporter TauE/SafE family protein [Bacteroidales bacterium]|nr:sulfite exporter TauE/SafE family protein [Bacteroidales bacterium]